MPKPRPEAYALGALFRLAVAFDPRRGPAGERLGKGTGASLEFQDRRDYTPGDDVRHLDWRALARTDHLLVRQYREEILPRLELLVDASRSMRVDEAKAQLAVDVCAVLASSARSEGFQVSLVSLDEQPRKLDEPAFAEHGLGFDGVAPLSAVLREASPLLRPGCVRLLVSDFLSPHVAADLVGALARGAGGLGLVQVLAKDDAEPPRDVALRLTDAESGEELDLVLEERIRSRYLGRLERLVTGLRSECLRFGGTHVLLDARESLEAHCKGALIRAGLLAPA